MTDSDSFLKAVAHYLKGIKRTHHGYAEGCPDCPEEQDPEKNPDEGGFSRSDCDSCGSSLGGGRYAAHGFDDKTGELYHLDICVDCLAYHANGEVPEEWTP